ncbi:arylesterase [Sphingomonas sp. 4RDLI-65]|uniref:arylesterase n=1 Tax=Sphingomonas sp. 4RDLI-65 TaxID=3111641 RepID=UPI003C1BD214
MEITILEKQTGLEKQTRRWPLYGVGLALLQAAALAGCDRGAEAPAPAPTANAVASVTESVAEVPAPSGPERLILAFGDSLYAGYGLDRGQSLPDAVQSRLRRDGINAKVVNAGVSGDTSAAGRQRFAFALDNMPRKPDLVLIGLGGNDVLRQISPAETRANMTAMLDEAKRRTIPVMLTGMMAPPNLGPDFTSQFNAIWPDLAKRYDVALYPFILDSVIGNTKLMQADHVHPNRTGVDRIAARVAPVVETALGKAD